ncbi:universal stress protein [Streptomyces sp. NBC_01462]|uniref:universal stress protein n=1 Tax=Streptomyces sp. NBC_01462 TaxID=2903876 RepID=UPI002E318A50|nr:universal stress protein [Streptomyces sp. NBC_01462]
MSRNVTVGLDGSPESTAAADWAAREALLRDAPPRLVHAWLWQQPYTYFPLAGAAVPPVDDQQEEWGLRLLRETAARIAEHHPDLPVSADLIAEPPVTGLLAAAEDADLLVLGSRGLGGVRGFLVGSVALAVVARAKAPLVLVRAGERAEEQPPTGDVVLGLDLEHPDATVIGFAFDAAVRRGESLRVVHGWSLPPYYGYGGALDSGLNFELDAHAERGLAEVLRPWQEKFPGVEAHGQVVVGSAASHLVDASRDAAMVVVGRRSRRSPAGLHVGPVTQAVLHHAMAPVVVVPHD